MLAEMLPTKNNILLKESAELVLEVFAHDIKLSTAVIGRYVYEILEYMRQSFPEMPMRRETILAKFAQEMERESNEVKDLLWKDLELTFDKMEE